MLTRVRSLACAVGFVALVAPVPPQTGLVVGVSCHVLGDDASDVRLHGVPGSPVVDDGHVDALRRAGVDDATWRITLFPAGPVIGPQPTRVLVLTLPLVRRLAVLDATVTLRDALGRTVEKLAPGVPRQPLGRPVTASERRR